MSKTIVCRDLNEFARRIVADMKKREKRVQRALLKVARGTKSYAEANTMPIAFGPLKQSGQVRATAEGATVTWDAPHAAAVEVGSRPHVPPIEPLIRWVKLRGMQGLDKKGRTRPSSKPGTTTAGHSLRVARQIHAGTTDAVATDTPERIARAIQHAIMVGGTKPHWFARKALTSFTMGELDTVIAAALQD